MAFVLWPFGKEQDESQIKNTHIEIPANIEDFQLLRVSVATGEPEVTVATDEPFEVFDGDGNALFEGQRIVSTSVRVKDQAIQFGGQIFRDIPITIQSRGDGIQVGNRQYRNAITMWPEVSGNVFIINDILVDDYLKGVLPWEANPKWPIEALKAQAVASRTYAMFRALQRRHEPYDLSNTVMSQVYKGKQIENETTDFAIETTRGQILTYQGKIFPAYFHSTCGGQTTAAHHVWPVTPSPVLQGTLCNFCEASKHYAWHRKFTEDEIINKLNQNGYKFTEIDRLLVKNVDNSGRAQIIQVQYGKKEIDLKANDFRIWVDPMEFKSTKIESLKKSGNTFLVFGHGWGHGVGMCQYGMKRLAELGYSYEQILEYYYPGSQITDIVNI